MIVKIGNQSFDSRAVPIALVLDDQDLAQIGSIGFKHDSQMEPKSLYVRWPVDISPEVLGAWLAENVTEFDTSKLSARYYNPGKKRD